MTQENACVIVSECVIRGMQPEIPDGIPVKVMSEIGKTEIKRGGVRPGSGRPSITTERPWQAEGISRATYYRRTTPPNTRTATQPEPIRWYCIRTEHGAETAVDMAVRSAGFSTLYPLMWVAPVAAGRTALGRAIPATSERLVPLLSSYLFVRFDRSGRDWRHIPAMRGVASILGSTPERPTPISDREIDSLRATLAPNGVKYPPYDPAQEARTKKRWVRMLDGLAGLVEIT